MTSLTLGKPYGIQLGSFDINSNYFPEDVRGKQALDTLLVAHGMAYVKRAIHWSQRDIDEILMLGVELHKETSGVQIDNLSQLTKGFTHAKHFIQVTMSEPVVVGKVMTLTDRSMNLQRGLKTFFSQHQHGILQTPSLDLYIVSRKVFLVFDPRGRTMDGERDANGEAALILLGCMSNLYHLIVNLSKVNGNDPFKISTVSVTQMMNARFSPDKFMAVSGDPTRVCRSVDYTFINDQVAYLRGNLYLGSKVFKQCENRQQLTTSIMAMVYSKIDPPNSWSSSILDRVLHFGTSFYQNCLDGAPIRNLTLADIPSSFYVGDVYRVSVLIVPFIKRVSLKPTRVVCDNPVTKSLKDIFQSTSFRCLLLQVDNCTVAVWQMKSTEEFYFFDGYQKDIDGNSDLYEGSSSLFMVGTIDRLCELVMRRLLMSQRSEKSNLDIHGMKLTELSRLTEKEMKCKPKLRLIKKDCIRPMPKGKAEEFVKSHSTVGSIAPVLTGSTIIKAQDEFTHPKPSQSHTTVKLSKAKVYEDVMTSVEKKMSMIDSSDLPPETLTLVRCIHSEILRKVLGEEDEPFLTSEAYGESNCRNEEDKNKSQSCCGKFVAFAEKVWLPDDCEKLDGEDEAEKAQVKPRKRPTKYPSVLKSPSPLTSSDENFDSAQTSPLNSFRTEKSVSSSIHLFNTILITFSFDFQPRSDKTRKIGFAPSFASLTQPRPASPHDTHRERN